MQQTAMREGRATRVVTSQGNDLQQSQRGHRSSTSRTMKFSQGLVCVAFKTRKIAAAEFLSA